jgi:hypothetical protein
MRGIKTVGYTTRTLASWTDICAQAQNGPA